jgi:hypothetical protein
MMGIDRVVSKRGVIVLLFIFSQCVWAQERKPFINRTLDRAYSVVQGDSSKPHRKYIILVPIVAYRPESKWVVGASANYFFRTDKEKSESTRLSFFRLNATYSQLEQLHIQPRIEIFTPENKWFIRAQYLYTDFSEYYWGIGGNAPNANRESYAFSMHRANLRVLRKFGDAIYAGMNTYFENMENMRFGEFSNFASSQVIGINGYRVGGGGLNFLFDNREHIYYPLGGTYIEFQQSYFWNALNDEGNFHQFVLDARHYKQLWKENVLAIQLFGTWNVGNVPFRMMGTLGNENYYRGYYQGRYRDHHAMAFQAELRKTVWGPLGMAVFGGMATVARTANELFSDLKPAVGAGLRFKGIPRERINLRIDYAIGIEGSRTAYITVNEAF